MTAFKFVSKPNVDFNALCGAAFEATDLKVAAFADSHSPKLSDDRKLASCLESFIGMSPLTLQPLIMSHLHFSGVLVCSDFDVPEVMMVASELACLSTPAKVRGLSMLILSGNLNAWRSAIVSGLKVESTKGIFGKVLAEFQAQGYADVFSKQGLLR